MFDKTTLNEPGFSTGGISLSQPAAGHAARFSENAARRARAILRDMFSGYHGPVAVKIWTGDIVSGSGSEPATLVFNHPGALRDLVLRRSQVRFAETHLAGMVGQDPGRYGVGDMIKLQLGDNVPTGFDRTNIATFKEALDRIGMALSGDMPAATTRP